MKIAILGAGHVGGTLGRKFTGAGHEVRYGVPDPNNSKYKGINALPVREAVGGSDVVLLAIPWPATEEALKAAGDLSGKIILDCTNPLKPDLSGLAFGYSDSAAERIAKWAPRAKVCKAFN